MCSDETCLGYLLLGVLVGFALLIYFLLQYRRKFLAQNLQLPADQIWNSVASSALRFGGLRTELIYGIWQDKTTTVSKLVLKNSIGDAIGFIEYPLASTEFKLVLGDEAYTIEYPPLLRRTAYLKKMDGTRLATFQKEPFSILKHRFSISDIGVITSKRPFFNFRVPFDYYHDEKIIGTVQKISSTREIGQLALLPLNYPRPVRIFILAVCARGL